MPKRCVVYLLKLLVMWLTSSRFRLEQDLDSALKLACESLISDSSSRIASLIRSFLDRCTSFLSSPGSKDLPGQSWATPEEVIKLHDEFQKGLDAQAKAVVSKLRVYLGDEKTIGVLLPPLLVSDRGDCLRQA